MKKKALLIIDVQYGLTSKKDLFNEIPLIETINAGIMRFRQIAGIIVFIQHKNKQLEYGSKDWEIDHRLERNPDDIVLHKQHGNAFDKTDLKSILDKNSVNEICVCGLVSHGCVKVTCLGGINEGFLTYLLKNGHTNWNKDAENIISFTEMELEEKGVNVIDLDKF